MAGVLAGLRIIEMGGIGPGPFAGMMLADHGTEVIRIDRPGVSGSLGDPRLEIINRSRRQVSINLKSADGRAVIRDLCASADGLIEGFRPGVMEKAGLGPDDLLAINPRLVYGRMTGWGQDGPLAQTAGHDIDYIALTGSLHSFGRVGEKPTPPINQIGDIGGGGMLLAFGMVAGLLAAQRTGRGQVVDCAMTDGAALLATMTWMFYAQGAWRDERGVNLLDSGAHFYDTYACADGRYLAVGAIEPQFYAELLRITGLADDPEFAAQLDPSAWPKLKSRLAARLAEKTRDEWTALFDGSDACVAPVLSMAEAPDHPHNAARGTFANIGGAIQPAPAPRFSNAPTAAPTMPAGAAAATAQVLAELGYAPDRIAALAASGAIVTEAS